jgi:hypothetical protein
MIPYMRKDISFKCGTVGINVNRQAAPSRAISAGYGKTKELTLMIKKAVFLAKRQPFFKYGRSSFLLA